MSDTKYPLLIQGIYSDTNGSRGSILPGGSVVNYGWTNNLVQNRGDLVAIDPVTTNAPGGSFDDDFLGTFSYFIGSEIILQDAPMSRYIPTAKPRSYELTQLRQKGGQSLRLQLTNIGAGPGLMVHHYFENQFATPEIVSARHSAGLKPRIKDFFRAFNPGVKTATSATFTVPTGIGNVVAVELFCELGAGATPTGAMNGLISVSFGGTTIFENVNTGTLLSSSGRPGLIFPILVRGGETFVIGADTSAVTGVLNIYMRLYFDEDRTGRKVYNLPTSC